MSYQNENGSTGIWKDGAFVPFASQKEADASLKPVKPADTDAPEPEHKPARRAAAKE